MNNKGFGEQKQSPDEIKALEARKIELYHAAGIGLMQTEEIYTFQAFGNNLIYWVAIHEGLIEEWYDAKGNFIRKFVAKVKRQFLAKSREGKLKVQLFVQGVKEYIEQYWILANKSKKAIRAVRDKYAELGLFTFMPVAPGTTRQAPVLEQIDYEGIITILETCEMELTDNRKVPLEDIGLYHGDDGLERSHKGMTICKVAKTLGYNYHPRKENDVACNFPSDLTVGSDADEVDEEMPVRKGESITITIHSEDTSKPPTTITFNPGNIPENGVDIPSGATRKRSHTCVQINTRRSCRAKNNARTKSIA